MQFIPSTAARFGLFNPYEPAPAIRAAARYVKVLSNLFGGRVDSILAAYNSGEGTVAAYSWGRSINNGGKIINSNNQKTIGGVPPYAETVGYVGRGLKIYRWLVLHQTFNAGLVRANFPAYISGSVARVSLYDPELGSVTGFGNVIPNNVLLTAQTNQIRPKNAAQTASENTTGGTDANEQKQVLNEVYYDSRSGNRYQVKTGVKIKLPETGAVVINTDSRPSNTPKARSTFFAAPPNK
jgi:Transglycosylase SLT domain